MTELQLEIMRLGADKTLSFGCIIRQQSHARRPVKQLAYYWIDASGDGQWKVSDSGNIKESECITIGHPITRGRLCYLFMISERDHKETLLFGEIGQMFDDSPELYNKTILERPKELQLLVRNFLLSIQ